ncbi:ATP-binding cassette domain-containing protein [Sulfuracidifex metallicus]|uniref:Molybdate/tungstate import ATP-binding protein WtpC n=1 Tax=Sulfuracidifex metallicus DSM 6482 = JCM 9184 TaxID=523847 RepID=A0A6A9QFQ1_SULME|nr:ATP-binding cassette domain-containing protein [Sulfuracidifex metallicus]MUN28057.1 ATP-binding cassette domain-containing protein [Sulfuracidifex metallicus DSM 6482 = JCM 9184]WOE51396.1 ATP-binding cassette domain-containing protein [Sulfuracidifex metallicus DSM 6482 = JCM 9184]
MIRANVKKRLREFFLDSSIDDEGTIAITGENGSGKSSLAKIINGSLKEDEGYIIINGIDVTSKKVGERGVILVTPSTYIGNLKAEDHLRWGYRKGIKRGNKLDIETVINELKVQTNKKVEDLSLGNKERISLATALLGKPDILIVDEGFSNINDKSSFMETYLKLCKANSIQLIFITQDLSDVKMTDHHYIMMNGKLKREY